MSVIINNEPRDIVSELRMSPFADAPNLMLVASWDNYTRLYDLNDNVIRSSCSTDAPVLCADFLDSTSRVIFGGLGRAIMLRDFASEKEVVIGRHLAPVCSLNYMCDGNSVVSGSWDRTVCLWDARMASLCSKTVLEGKPYFIDVLRNTEKFVVADSEFNIMLYDSRNLALPVAQNSNIISHQPSALKVFPNNLGCAIGTIEGCVHMQYFDELAAQADKTRSYSFKCHRKVISDPGAEVTVRKMHSVNCIAFKPDSMHFTTGGSDGILSHWDGVQKKRLWCSTKPFQASVVAGQYNLDGSSLALAISNNDYESIKNFQTPFSQLMLYKKE